MISNPELDELLTSLTAVQRQAAEWTDGALVLLAGPGSGKTRVLTSRIAKLLMQSPDATWRLLALTFTTRAADEMRTRIGAVASQQADRLLVGTFHSFAVELLRQSGSHVGVRTDFKIYSTQADRLALLEEAIRAKGVDFPEPVGKAFFVLDGLRDRLVGPDTCASLFSSGERAEYFSRLYAAYHEHLSDQNALDFPAIIFKCHELLTRFPAIAQRYRRTYRYICIDEFQDTNAAQYALIKSFTGSDYRNVFVVADDDQVIYQWNGASPKRLQEFRTEYGAELIQMPTNFRCPGEVVELANRLVANNRLRSPGKRPLEVGKVLADASERVRLLTFGDEHAEAGGVAADIEATGRHHSGSMAVLARTKKILEGVQVALTARGIESRIAQRRDDFASVPYQWLSNALQLANRRSDAGAFRAYVESGNALLGYQADVDELIASAATSHGDFLRAWISWAGAAVTANPMTPAILSEVVEHLSDRNDFHKFARASVAIFNGYKEPLESIYASVDEDADAWKQLYREIVATVGRDAPLDSFLQELEMRSKEPPLKPGTIPLLTIHSSKGNEFSHVYVAGLAEDVLPSFQSKKQGEHSPEMEEERRNCFVAITRCMDTLTMSWASSYNGWTKQPSRFLAEMFSDPNSLA